MNNRHFFANLLGITLAVGTIYGVIKFLEWLEKQGADYILSDFSNLIKNQKTLDELNATEIMEWIKDVKSTTSEELSYIIAYPTPETIEKFHLKGFPENIDKEHNIILLAVKKESYTPVKIQMLSFGIADEKLVSALFNGQDYAVVEE